MSAIDATGKSEPLTAEEEAKYDDLARKVLASYTTYMQDAIRRVVTLDAPRDRPGLDVDGLLAAAADHILSVARAPSEDEMVRMWCAARYPDTPPGWWDREAGQEMLRAERPSVLRFRAALAEAQQREGAGS